MSKVSLAAGLSLLLMAAAVVAAPERPRVGVLFWHDSPNDRAAFEGVRAGFDLTGRDPRFEIVRAGGDDAVARAALRRFDGDEGVELVYAMGTAAALRARDEVHRAPVVFTAVTDPLGSGVVDDVAGSGGRLCGNASGVAAADALTVFRRALPGLRTLGVVHDPANPVSRAEVAAMAEAGAAAEPPVALVVEERSPSALEAPGGAREAAAALRDRCDALWIPIDFAVYGRSAELETAFAGSGKPILATAVAASRSAAAVCVAADLRSLGRASVVQAVAVLDGADPGRLPVNRPRAYRVLVNLEAARRGGFEVPLGLLAATDEFVGVAGGR